MHHVTLINSNVFQTEDLCACASPPPEPETDLQKTESMTCDDNIITSTGSTGTDRPAGEQPRSAADTEPQCALPARRSGMDSHFVVRATLGGDHVDTLIDTGATMTLIKPWGQAYACRRPEARARTDRPSERSLSLKRSCVQQ